MKRQVLESTKKKIDDVNEICARSTEKLKSKRFDVWQLHNETQ